ncbi:nucleotidyl transferase AbiEii/AbiGii toxin family protein [Deltaproteobacteria bacterium TL4]
MIHSAILDTKRQALLPYFSKLPQQFYLAGGTGLALQFGHRISDDFDFFCAEPFDTQDLYATLTQDVFTDINLTIIQEAKNTLDVLTDSKVKLSFIRYRYHLLYELINTEHFPIADYHDIAAMKLIACAQRATQKDYIDLYVLLEHLSLKDIFTVAAQKYPDFNLIIYLKSLTYFDDCDDTPVHMLRADISVDAVKQRLTQEAYKLFDDYGLR